MTEKARSRPVKLSFSRSRHRAFRSKSAPNLPHAGDYLFEAFRLREADFVIGNPPYVRLEDIPQDVAGLYRASYPTMTGRADLYVAFYEAALRQLKPEGVCAFICADRWMLNQYGAELRNLVTSAYAVEAIVEMHHADAFQDTVSAYPAITILRRGLQKRAVVAAATPEAESQGPESLAKAVKQSAKGGTASIPGLTIAAVKTWFTNSDPWPCGSPKRIELLRHIEERFGLLESEDRTTRVGIGVATGLDDVFITTNPMLVEESRLLPLALARDTFTGRLHWSGHYLVDPWNADGLVDLAEYPRLKAYFEGHAISLKKRHTSRKSPAGWYRTIDRVTHSLTARAKLYIPDIKDRFNPVLDDGDTYPHHNLYFIQSDAWDLEVLGGILLSSLRSFSSNPTAFGCAAAIFVFRPNTCEEFVFPIHELLPRNIAQGSSKLSGNVIAQPRRASRWMCTASTHRIWRKRLTIETRLQRAVQNFWDTRSKNFDRQAKSGRKDVGARGAVTAGTQMAALERLVADILREAGIDRFDVKTRTALELPGYYRAEKKWDLIVVSEARLILAMEFKSQVGPSFGNNFNNRSEEALGSATCLWTAYREGRFGPGAPAPFLGYFFLLEDCPSVHKPVKNREPHFSVDPVFKGGRTNPDQ